MGRARDAFNFRRTEGVGRSGAVLGELRALLGGSARAAQAYTQPRTSTSAASSDDGPAEPEPEPEPSAPERDAADRP